MFSSLVLKFQTILQSQHDSSRVKQLLTRGVFTAKWTALEEELEGFVSRLQVCGQWSLLINVEFHCRCSVQDKLLHLLPSAMI